LPRGANKRGGGVKKTSGKNPKKDETEGRRAKNGNIKKPDAWGNFNSREREKKEDNWEVGPTKKKLRDPMGLAGGHRSEGVPRKRGSKISQVRDRNQGKSTQLEPNKKTGVIKGEDPGPSKMNAEGRRSTEGRNWKKKKVLQRVGGPETT